jgi:hypothetical protein
LIIDIYNSKNPVMALPSYAIVLPRNANAFGCHAASLRRLVQVPSAVNFTASQPLTGFLIVIFCKLGHLASQGGRTLLVGRHGYGVRRS